MYPEIPLSEVYNVVSSEGIRNTEVKTGVLLHFSSPKVRNLCKSCAQERLSCILAAGGYILQHTGDLIVVEWEVENVQLSATISQAIQCAFTILEIGTVQHMSFDLKRQIKIAISAGTFSRVRLGDEMSLDCVVLGPAVDRLRSAMLLADYGDIVLSPETWQHCDRTNITVTPVSDEGAVKVQHIRQEQSVSQQAQNFDLDDLINGYPRKAYLLTNEERGLIIHKCIMQIALDKLHENKELHDLPEFWPATVMFVNLQFRQLQTGRRENFMKINEIIEDEISRCRGGICNVFSFEEGYIFLCVIGLPGDERQDTTDLAMQAAYWIHEMCLREIDGLGNISVGLSTGRILYEMKENSLRQLQQYKVYGQTVRLAGKFAMECPGIVSFDTATKLYSKLPLSGLITRRMMNPYDPVLYEDKIFQLLDDEATMSPRRLEGRRTALAHIQTMLQDEQMVVKYASAIGQTFSIDMLKSILSHMTEEDLIVPLTSLVRVGIIKCASTSKDASSTVTCDCQNNSGECTQASTDPVWPCRLMSFCNKDVMEMVHELIERSENLLQVIHKKCANYLGKRSYRCRKCEAKDFIYRHKVATANSNLQQIYKEIRPYEIFQSPGSPCHNQIDPAEGNGDETENFLSKMKSLLEEPQEKTTTDGCECAQLVETVLIPRLRHWTYAGDMTRTFFSLLDCAVACVYLQNDARALEFLTKARSILLNLNEERYIFPSAGVENVQIDTLQQAFLYQFIGEIMFKAGRILEAEESFKTALKILNCNLPQNKVALSMKLMHEKMKKLRYRSRQFEIPEKTKLERLQKCIHCLSFLWQINFMHGKLKNASLAITMEINMAMRSGDPFKILYSAIDYLKYSQLKGKDSKCRRLKEFLCRACASLSDHPKGQNLISHLTRTLAVGTMRTGDLEQSIECTMRGQQLNEVLNGPGLDARTTAALHLPLLLTDRHRESVQQVLTLENVSEGMWSSLAKGWFYASCLNFLLYAGFAVKPFEECLSFVEAACWDMNLDDDKSLMLHLYSAVALWYARLENWEKFAVFFLKAHVVYAHIPSTVESISGVVMLLECSVLLLRKELTERSRRRITTLKRAQKLFLEFRQLFGKTHILTPRMLHLQAYLYQLTGNKIPAQDLLKDALLLCEKQGNVLDHTWIKQSQNDWSGECSDTPAEWSTTVLSMPSWDEAAMLQPEQLLKYHFHLQKLEDKQRPSIFGKRPLTQ